MIDRHVYMYVRRRVDGWVGQEEGRQDEVSRLGSRRLDEYSLVHVCSSTISYHGWTLDKA